MITSIDLL